MPAPVAASIQSHSETPLAGSLIGGIAEALEMLDFCGEHNMVSDIEMIPIQNIDDAYERMLKSDPEWLAKRAETEAEALVVEMYKHVDT